MVRLNIFFSNDNAFFLISTKLSCYIYRAQVSRIS